MHFSLRAMSGCGVLAVVFAVEIVIVSVQCCYRASGKPCVAEGMCSSALGPLPEELANASQLKPCTALA